MLAGVVVEIEDDIESWTLSGGSEWANFQIFANDLCELLNLPKPDPAAKNSKTDAYCSERPVTFIHTGSQSCVSSTFIAPVIS